MERTSREKEKAKEKGRWREENGGPVKCRWRVVGRGRRGGGLCDGALSSLFFPFREHPLLSSIVPQCDSWSWQCEGENKNELAVQPGSMATSDATPLFQKKKAGPTRRPGGDETWSRTHSDPIPETLKRTIVSSRISCTTKTVSVFLLSLSRSHKMRDTSHIMLPAHTCICKYQKLFRNSDSASLAPARGHANALASEANFSILLYCDSVWAYELILSAVACCCSNAQQMQK